MAEPVRFYLDEHVWSAVAKHLRASGIDVLTAHDARRRGLPDLDQLAFAAAEERVVVTFDVDYVALHNAGVAHAGIAWCREQKYSIGELLDLLKIMHGVFDRDEMRGRLEYF